MRKITLTNALGGAAILCGGSVCVLMAYFAFRCVLGAICDKSLDGGLVLFFILPFFCFLGVLCFMAINRGRALIKLKTKDNIIATVKALSVFFAILFFLTTTSNFPVFLEIVPFFSFFVAPIVLGISAYVLGCRFVLRKEGFEYTKGELLGKSLANIIAIVVWFSCVGIYPHLSSDSHHGIVFLFFVIPIFIAYGVYRLCCWGFKRI